MTYEDSLLVAFDDVRLVGYSPQAIGIEDYPLPHLLGNSQTLLAPLLHKVIPSKTGTNDERM